jgi:dTMP kinase
MKKKTSLYIFVPLIALVLFFAYYWNFNSGYEQALADRAAAHKRQVDANLKQQNDLRLKAVNDAIAAQAKRKAEKEAKDARNRQEADDHNKAVQARDKAHADALSLSDKVDRLTGQVKAEKDDLARVEQDKKSLVAQLDFLEIDVKKANANQEALANVLKEISAADAAAAAAARAAAAAAAAAAAK